MAEEALSTMIWTVSNFDMNSCMPGECLFSPKFSVGSYHFHLSLYPKGKERNASEVSLAVYLTRIDHCPAKQILVNRSCVIFFNIVNKSINLLSKSERKFGKNLGWGRCVFRGNDLFDKFHDLLRCLNDNQMIIKCEIYDLKEIESDNQFEAGKTSETLSDNLADILERGLYTDIVINAGNDKFKVHKFILKNRCPALFNSLKRNENDEEYSLKIDASVLQVILQYLYSGIFTMFNCQEEIIDACVKYGIFHLEHALKSLHSIIFKSITEIPVSKLSFKWSISEFSKIKLNQEIVYPAYCMKTLNWKYQTKIYLTVVKSENASTSLELKFKNSEMTFRKFIRCKVTFFKPEDFEPKANLLQTQSGQIIKKYELISDGPESIVHFLSHSDLCQVLCNDSLDMFFDISMSSGTITPSIEEVSMVNIKTEKARENTIKNIKLLQKDFRSLYNNMDLPDVTLCVDGNKLFAHRVFLCGRSPVFAMMFENDCLENKNGVINITDIESKIVSKMLLYIYCGCIDSLSISDAIKLYTAADKYELLTLKDECGVFLKNNIDAENVSEILYIADRHNDTTLKTCVNDFLKSNPKQTMEPKNTVKTRVLQTRRTAYVYKY